MVKGKAVEVIYVDFSKAFNTVSHSILITKLWRCGLDVCVMGGKLAGQLNPKGCDQWYEVQAAASY